MARSRSENETGQTDVRDPFAALMHLSTNAARGYFRKKKNTAFGLPASDPYVNMQDWPVYSPISFRLLLSFRFELLPLACCYRDPLVSPV
jgi:hypothetical protein